MNAQLQEIHDGEVLDKMPRTQALAVSDNPYMAMAQQALALGNSQSSVERTQAVIHSYSILDAMRANRDDAIAGNYSSGLICPGDAVPGAGISGADLDTWIQSVRASLQTGCAQVQNNADVFTVTVQWNDQRGSGGNAAQQVVTVSRL